MQSVLSLALLGLLLATGDAEQDRQERLAKASRKAQEAKQRQHEADVTKLCGTHSGWPRAYAEAVLVERDRAIEGREKFLKELRATKPPGTKANSQWYGIYRKKLIALQRARKARLDPLEMPEPRSPRNWKVGDICTLEYLEVVGVKDGTTLAVKVGQSRAVGMQRGLNTNPRMTPTIQPVWERQEWGGGTITDFPTEAANRKALALNGVFQVISDGSNYELKFLGAYGVPQ